MTNDEALHHWLAEEVRDLFQSGGVGLYEFIEILNSDYRPTAAATLSPAERKDVSTRAMHELLASGDCVLRWKVWATDYDEPATTGDITDAAWQTPTAAPYLQIELIDDRPSRPLLHRPDPHSSAG